MKFNPLRDWHYAMHVDSPFDQGSSFLMSLDLISWKANEQNYLEAAIEQLQLLDDHYTIYAYPQLLTTLFELEDNSDSSIIIDSFCKKFLEKLKIDKSISSLNEIKEQKNTSILDQFRKSIGSISETESIGGKYKDTLQYRDASIILSYLYAMLSSNAEFLHTCQSIYNDETQIKDFLQSAYDCKYGRLSFIIACRILNMVDHENYRSNINEHILKKINYNNILTEPDLTELLIQAELFPFAKEHNCVSDETNEIDIEPNESSNVSQLEGKVKSEFYDLKHYSELRDNYKANDRNRDNYFYYQLFSTIPTSELENEDLKNAFTITCWQFNLLYCYFLSTRNLSIKLFDNILFDPEYDIRLNTIHTEDTNLNTIYKLKSSRTSKGIYPKSEISVEDKKKHTYSPFPNIMRSQIWDFGIERDDSVWFQNQDEPFLYLRMGLFGFITSLYLSDNIELEDDFKNKLLRFSAYNICFDKFYSKYLILSAHDNYNNAFEKHLENKKTFEEKEHGDKPFILGFGSQNQLIIQKVLAQRTKRIPRLKSVDLAKDFDSSSVKREYVISSDKNKNELYFNLVLPDALYYWIIETYLSYTISFNQTALLSRILLHQALLLVRKGKNMKNYYGQINFNQDRFSCLLSFHIGNVINIDSYSHFSFNDIDIKKCGSPRSFLTIKTEKELLKLLDEKTTQQINELKAKHKRPELYKSIKILDIIDNGTLENDYSYLKVDTIDALYKELSSIKKNQELDRYVRLQLIRLINNEILKQDKDDKVRETIIYLILEYGGIYDIDLLFNAIFVDKDKRTGELPANNQNIQKKFIHGFYTLLGPDASSSNLIESPYKVAYKKNKAEFIRKKLNWLTFSVSNDNENVILAILKKCNNDEIWGKFKEQNNYKEKQVDTLLTAENNVYIERNEEIRICDLHSVYYDPNSYTANLLIMPKQSTKAKIFNGKTIKLNKPEVNIWNNLEKIVYDRREKYKSSDWLVDIIGIKSGLYNSIQYPILSYKIENGTEMPFPKSMVELLFFKDLSNEGVFRLILLAINYTNPINNKKGHLWTAAYGINFFVELSEYTEHTLEIIGEKIRDIEFRYRGKTNPSRGLIAYFKVKCNEDEKLIIEFDKDLEDQPILDEANIRIEYDLFSNIKESVKKNNEWVIDLNSDLFANNIKVEYNASVEGNSRTFDFDNFTWNPFTNILKELIISLKSTHEPKKNNNGSGFKGKQEKELDQHADLNRENLEEMLEKMPTKLKANFVGHYKVRLVDCKLPDNLIYKRNSIEKINWTDTFKYSQNVKIFSLSPSDTKCRSFIEDFGNGYNGYINLMFRHNRTSQETKLFLHTLKEVTPIYFSEFINFFNKLSQRHKNNLQIIFIGEYNKEEGLYSYLRHTANPNAKEYVFEFGYGRIIILKDTEIQIFGSKISETSSILYHGDKLSRIRINKNIVTVDKIDNSFIRSIYEESTNRNLIHTLYIDVEKKKIRRILGSNTFGYNPDYTHKNNGNAILSDESIKYLKDAYSDSTIDEIILYGKVDPVSFETSNGHELIFNIIKLSNNPKEKNEGLMFFKADYIYFENNAYRLKINPVLNESVLESLDENYKNACFINKRDFSVDAYKLINLFNENIGNDEKKADILKGRLLLVRVSYDNEKLRHTYSLIGSRESISSGNFQMPFRNEMVIQKQLEEHSVKAIIVTKLIGYRNNYIVELKPGIFISVKPNNNDDNFCSGDIIQISKVQDKIYFDLLIPSDERYFSQTKFAHILPKNNIVEIDLTQIEDAKKKLVENKYFIGADFPNIELQLNETCPSEKLMGFFGHENKICIVAARKVNIERTSIFKFTPKIIFAHFGSNTVKANDFERSDSEIILPPYSISFQETSYNNLLKAILEEKWQYIDKETFIWDISDQKWDNKSLNYRGYRTSPIPVYFDYNDRYTLRYPVYKLVNGKFELDTKEISKISLPTQTLLNYLKIKITDKRERAELTIVCCEKDTLWLELSPGRIVEVNTNFLRLQNTNLSLKNIASGILSTGDKLELYLPEIDYGNDGIEAIEVLAWIPSSRGAFNSDTILPCSDYKQDGSVELGAGIFKMFIPIQDKRIKNGLSYFNSFTNYFKAIGDDSQKFLNCCMVYIDNCEIKLTIEKYNDYKISIQNDDPYLKEWFSNQRIDKILEHSGNYLPVTIEKIDHKDKTICISRKYQNRIELRSNDLLIYNLLGKLDETTLLLISGFLLFPCNIKEFVKYIPQTIFNNELIKILSKKLLNRLCLIRSATGFNIGIGLNELKEPITFKCKFVHVVCDESNPGIIVFNQVHKSLHFISYKNCFWIKAPKDISKHEILDVVFRSNSKPTQIYAHLNPETGFCSLIETDQAVSEFDSIQKGKNISVEYIAPLGNSINNSQGYTYYIVKSRISNVYLLAESILDKNKIEKRDKATVIYFSKENKNVLVVIGEKIIVMDTYKLKHSTEELDQNTDKEVIDKKIDNLTLKGFNNERINELLNWGEENILKRKYLYLYDPLKFLVFTKKLIDEGQIELEFAYKIKELCVSIIIDLGLRAIRERHSEVLISKWLHNNNISKEYDLWGRFNGLGKQIFRSETTPITKDDYGAIENLYKVAIPLRAVEEDNDFKLLGDALMVAIGQNSNISIPEDKTPIISKLITISFNIISILLKSKSKISTYDEDINFTEFQELIDYCELEKAFFYLRENTLIKYVIDELSYNCRT